MEIVLKITAGKNCHALEGAWVLGNDIELPWRQNTRNVIRKC